MHKKVNTLLTEKSNNLCIQYVFCSFGPEWEDSTKYLIAVYLENDLETTRSIYDEWFEIGKNDPDAFMKKYKANINNKPVLDEYDKHLKFGQNHCCPEKSYHKVGCSTEPASGTQTGVVG